MIRLPTTAGTEPAPITVTTVRLEAALDALSCVGLPRVAKHPSGWFCAVKSCGVVPGVHSEVRSEFGHGSALAAAIECVERVWVSLASGHLHLRQTILRKLGGAA